ncbi:type II toxin-antitoxin system PemK/MazF family toxin [Sporofaciens musculi]
MIKTMVLLEQIRTIDKKRIRHYIGKLSEKDMEQVDRCLGISLDLKIISN